MPKDINSFIRACSRVGLLIDTNLLILLAVGNKNRSEIAQHKRTCNYTEQDYDLILKLLKISNHRLYITPYIVSEVSNFLVDAKNGQGTHSEVAKALIKEADESHHHKDDILNIPELSFLGFTDVSIIKTANDLDCGVITNDNLLYQQLSIQGRNVAHLQTLTTYGAGFFTA